MIYNQTILNVTDNSGALTLNCIRILNKSKKKAGKIGDLIVLSIKTLKSKQKIQRKSVYRGAITRTKKSFVRKNGINISFQDNSGVILNNKGLPVANRQRGGSLFEVKKNLKSSALIKAKV